MSREVVAGGLRVHFQEAGNGPPVLLLHGWPQHHYLWRRVIPALSAHHRLIAPDLRGFGWTEAPGSGYDGDTLAADQVALLDALGIDRTHVIAHDWGGWVAFLLGIDHPSRVDRMIVCNAPHPWGEISSAAWRQAFMSWYAITNATPGLGRFLHRRTGWIGFNIRRDAGDAVSAAEREIFAAPYRDPARAAAITALYRYYLRLFAETGRAEPRGRLRAPTRLLFGERDVMISPELVRTGFEEHSDDMTLELVPGASHFIVDERPDLIAERARELFAAQV